MITSSIKARRNYNPLTVACSVKLAADSASLSQIYDTESATYSPNRSTTSGRLKLQPSVNVYAVDGSVLPVDIMSSENQSSITSFIESMTTEWQSASDISRESNWEKIGTSDTNYSIDNTTSSSTFGQLTYKKNNTAGTKIYFRFKCSFTDKRRGITETVYSDPICSECIEKALDEVRLYTDDNLNILYNPFFDANTSDIHFCLKRGKEKVEFDTIRYNLVVKNQSGTTIADITGIKSADNYLTKCTTMSYNSLINAIVHIFNGKGTDKKDYVVQLIDKQKSNRVVDTRYISLQRLYPTFDIVNTNHSAFEPNTKRKDSCIVTSCRKRVTNPANYLTIDWYVFNASGSAIKKASGESVTLDLTSTGFSTLKEGFDMYFNVDYKSTIGKDNI